MSYIDGFIAPVSAVGQDAYLHHARICAEVFKECGAVKIIEGWQDDVPEGKRTSMPLAVQRGAGEVVVFSLVIWPDKATRDAGWQKFAQDERVSPEVLAMPFDGARLIHGGFQAILEA